VSPFPVQDSPTSSNAVYYEEHFGKWEHNYDCDKLKGECKEVNKPCPKLPEGMRITCEKTVLQWKRKEVERSAQIPAAQITETKEQTYRSIVPPIMGLTMGIGHSHNPHRAHKHRKHYK